jgi:hypothetical protein
MQKRAFNKPLHSEWEFDHGNKSSDYICLMTARAKYSIKMVGDKKTLRDTAQSGEIVHPQGSTCQGYSWDARTPGNR